MLVGDNFFGARVGKDTRHAADPKKGITQMNFCLGLVSWTTVKATSIQYYQCI